MVIWLNGTVGAGKSAVGQALAAIMPDAVYVDGDDYAGSSSLPRPLQWRAALDALLQLVVRSRQMRVLVVAYPLRRPEHARLRAVCARAHRALAVVTLAPSLSTTLCGRGGRELDSIERKRVREMRSEGYHRRRFATLTLPNFQPPPARTALLIKRRLQSRRSTHNTDGRCSAL